MKKVKIISGAILRSVLLLTPGIAFGWWAWNKAIALISIFAAVGLETVFLFVFSFITVTIQVWKEARDNK